jgi:hypothetical protein
MASAWAAIVIRIGSCGTWKCGWLHREERESLINLVIFVFVADVKRKARLNTHVPNHVIAPGAFKPDQTKLMELRRTLNLIMKTVGRDSF